MMRPKLPIDFNSNSAYEKLKFVADNYENLVQMFMTIMEHLKLPVIEPETPTVPDTPTEGECLFEQYTVTNSNPVYVKLHLRGNLKEPTTPLYIGNTTTPLRPPYVASLTGNYGSDNQVPYPNNDPNLRYVVRIYYYSDEADYTNESTLNDIDDECDNSYGFKYSYYTPKLAIFNTTTEQYEDTFTGDFETELINILYDEAENAPSSLDFLRILQIAISSNYTNYTDTTIGIEQTNEYEYALDMKQEVSQFVLILGSTTVPSGDWVKLGTQEIYLEDWCSGTAGNYIDLVVSVVDNGWSMQILSRSVVEIPHTFTYTIPKDNSGVRR